MERRVQSVLTIICGIALVVSWIVPLSWLPILAVAAGSWFALKSAWEAVKERELDVNLLMLAAAVGSVMVGHISEAAVLLFLFSLSNTLEAYAMGRTRSAIEALVKLRPKMAVRVDAGGDVEVPVEDIQPGDLVRILSFQQIPVDGEIVSGETSVNQAAMTGESVPVSKTVGESVLAGTQNLDGMVVAKAKTAAGDTALDKIVSLVRDAQENKASGERISQWFGQRYTFFVMAVFVVSLAIRSLVIQEPVQEALYSSLVLLVALSPCAIVISSPAASLSALAWAARNGILVRGGEFVETAGNIQAICVDKTGTLTAGVPQLAEICVCSFDPESSDACREEDACWHRGGSMSDRAAEALRLAAAAEQYSTHPLAGAIVKAAVQQGLTIPAADHQTSFPGLGVEAVIEGQTVRIGQRRFFEQEHALDPAFAAHVEEIQRKGMTVAILRHGDSMVAFGLRDEPRTEAAAVLKSLGSLGIKDVVLLTGDTPQTAEAVASELQVKDVRAGLLPADKEEIIAGLEDSGRKTLMVGDGINDAPSLARASLGMAMGGLGSDIAMNAADVVLMQDRLERIPQFIALGRKTNGIIRANLIFAGGVIGVLTLGSIILSAAAPQMRAALLPFAVVGHEGSTVLVILNGLRLLRGPGKV